MRAEHSSRRRGTRLLGVAVLALTVMVGTSLPDVAVAAAPVAVGTAAIEGEVLGNFDPLDGATVTVLDAASGYVLKSVTTTGSTYRIEGLPAGAVKVRATKPGWLPSFANGKTTLATADVFTLEAGKTLTQSWDPAVLYLDLMQEAVIEGQTLSWMDPLGGITVTVLDASTGKVLGSAVSDINADYRIGMLPAGTVKVRASKAGYLTSFADGASTFATARSFTLISGQTLSQTWDPMALYLDVAPEAVIEGQVLGDGAPLSGATVTALKGGTNAVLGSVVTDAQGHYRLGGLPTTDVKLRATKAGWLTGFANGQTTLGTADTLALMGGSVLTDPLLELHSEGVITGSVLGINDDESAPWDDPLPGVRVTAYDAVTGVVVRTVITDGLGTFRLDRLPAGGYKVRASLAGWLTTFANGKSTLATADVISVAAGETLPLPQELVLFAEASFEGQLLGWSDPIDGTVTVLNATTGRVVRSVSTTGTSFRVGGLPAGQYKVRGSSPGWLTRYSNEAVTWEQAPVYDLHAGQHVVQNPDDWALGFYVDLTPEAVVTGSVMGFSNNPDHPWDDPLSDVTVTALDPVTRKVLGHTTTDSLGEFRIGMLEKGQVLLRASRPGWVTSFAGPVPVEPWVPNPPTQLTIYEAATIEGQVLGEMDPLGGANVTVLSADTGRVLGSTVADGDGYYRITGLPPGPVKVRATKTGWYAGFANGRTSYATADVLTLVEGVTLTQQWDPMVLYLDLRPRPTS